MVRAGDDPYRRGEPERGPGVGDGGRGHHDEAGDPRGAGCGEQVRGALDVGGDVLGVRAGDRHLRREVHDGVDPGHGAGARAGVGDGSEDLLEAGQPGRAALQDADVLTAGGQGQNTRLTTNNSAHRISGGCSNSSDHSIRFGV